MQKRVPRGDTNNSGPNLRYRKDLVDLKQRFLSFFDQMIALDLTIPEERKEALTKTQRQITKIYKLCTEHLGATQMKQRQDPKLQDLHVSVENAKDLKEEGEIWWKSTNITFKNETSFMVANFHYGIGVIENSRQLYCKLPEECRDIGDIAYIPSLNSYLIAGRNNIYRKDIDSKPPYIYLGVFYKHYQSPLQNTRLEYSDTHNRIIFISNRDQLSLMNPKTKKI